MGWSPAMQQMITMKYEYANFALSLSPNHLKVMQRYSILPKIMGQVGIQTQLNNLKVTPG